MDVCYNKLFKLLIDKNLKKTEFAKEIGISQATLAKLSNNKLVSLAVIIKICKQFKCTPNDILEVTISDTQEER